MNSNKLKAITTFKSKDDDIRTLCFLRDGRLVSGGGLKIVVYNKDTYQPDLVIGNYYRVYSFFALRNGYLASTGGHGVIEIYKIDGNEYELLYEINQGFMSPINKVIELEDGRLCSCSNENKITVWSNNYFQSLKTLQGHTDEVTSIMEMNNYIISSSYSSVIIWDKNTYESVKTIEGVYCYNSNGLLKLKENTVVLGGKSEIYILDILSFKYKSFQDDRLSFISSICALGEEQILIGNNHGEISCYNSLSNQIVFTEKIHNDSISCLIKSEDKKIFSCSLDDGLKIMTVE